MPKTAEELGYKPVKDPEKGLRVHLSWAYNTCVWDYILKLDDKKCVVQAAKSGKYLVANLKDLRHLANKA